MSELANIESGLVNVAKKVKAGIEEAGEDSLKLMNFVQKNQVLLTGLASLAGAKGPQVEQVGLNLIGTVATAVKGAGDAASANGLSVTFDAAAIADVKALVAALEKL